MRVVTARERNLLMLLGLSLPALAIWQLVLTPALELRAASHARIAEADAVAALLDQLPQDGLVTPARDLPPLRRRVTDTAQSADVDIQRLDPQGAALSVSLDAIAFATLVGWLDLLTGTHRVRILGADITRRPEPGIVSAQLLMEDAS